MTTQPSLVTLTSLPTTPAAQQPTARNWRDFAACLDEDLDLFFPSGSTGPAALQIEEAKDVCRRCPVMDECLQWALATREQHGVWGGLSEDERQRQGRQVRRVGARNDANVGRLLAMQAGAKIVLMREAEGLSREDIADRMQVSVKVLKTALLLLLPNEPGRKGTALHSILSREDSLKTLLLAGRTNKEIAETMGASIPDVSRARAIVAQRDEARQIMNSELAA